MLAPEGPSGIDVHGRKVDKWVLTWGARALLKLKHRSTIDGNGGDVILPESTNYLAPGDRWSMWVWRPGEGRVWEIDGRIEHRVARKSTDLWCMFPNSVCGGSSMVHSRDFDYRHEPPSELTEDSKFVPLKPDDPTFGPPIQKFLKELDGDFLEVNFLHRRHDDGVSLGSYKYKTTKYRSFKGKR
ncbi:hypothetical protein L2E82_42680 [Cichorium intybus]|uniref:Uncharacterized protein n=1 Tax=Cichorium intybus TaxID=13427 RepID=A0ACB8ZLG0_CICIN|nr:hypothetical protein L2E82_42680 [Cichorium intybus]